MCGICGFVGLDDNARLEAMKDALVHRGPDDEGSFLDDGVGLGHRRLSIVDLSTGRQPMHNEDESSWIVYNGELYNHLTLRAELEAKGHRYYTSSDTETILHLYEEYGANCVERMNGMFAFAIWDKSRKKLFLARDRVGVKPLYYSLRENVFYFASEITSMLKAFDEKPIVDSEAVYEYLFFQYIPTPRTIFTGIRKLAPGHTLEFDGGIVSIREYWDVKYSQKKDSDERIHSKKILEILDDSVQTRLMSDVPLGAFLSGGLDSSGIVSLMSRRVEAPIDTFSVGFEDVPDAYNELSHARKVSEIFGTTHHEVLMNPSGAVKILPQVISRLDEPLGDYAVLPTFAVSELARRRVKVVLTGEGADELFGGYYHYLRELEKHRMLYAGRKKSFLKAKIKSPLGQEGSVWQDSLDPWYAGSTNIFTPHQKKELLEENPDEALNAPSAYKKAYRETTASHILDKMLYADFKIWLPDDLLMKVDWMSMAHSLEARVPYLDHRLVEYAAGIPWNLKIRGGTLKYILKKSLSGVLPRQIVRRRKHGFTVPLKEWFNGELGDFAFQVLDKSSIFNRDYVKKISWKNSRVACSQLWRLFVLESWVKTHVYGEKLC